MLVRSLKLERAGAAGKPLWYRAAASPTIVKQKDGTFLVGKILNISIQQDGGDAPTLRKRGNQWELLVPVHWNGNRAAIVHTYTW